jgi:hypothetical protein
MEMMPKFLGKKADPLRRLPLLILKSQAWTRKGNVSTNYFLQVPWLQETRQGKRLPQKLLKLKFLMLWTRELTYSALDIFSSCFFC